MGVMSRRVLPFCGRMFVCCPGLRARSRQPVKRYKRMLTELFPRNQEDLNERKIGKLCDYAAQNPTRLPKIANALEQRGYKELRLEKYGYVRTVMKSYSKLLSTCRDQIPLFAMSVISMIRALLDHRRDDMRILGCETFVDFVRNQNDGAYIRTLDGLLPKLCALARETGEEKRRRPLRAAGIRSLAIMVWFMGVHSHISPNFDEIMSAILDNYEISPLTHHRGGEWEEEEEGLLGAPPATAASGTDPPGLSSVGHAMELMVREGKAAVATVKGAMGKLRHAKGSDGGPVTPGLHHVGKAEMESSGFWAHSAVLNIARLCKEATTTRRVLDPMLRYFDNGNHWPPPPPSGAESAHTLASEVLREMQDIMDKAGVGPLLLSAVFRHLDNKNVAGKARLQAGIMTEIALLAKRSRAPLRAAGVSAMEGISKHLRRSLLATRKSGEEGPEMSSGEKAAHGLLKRSAEEALAELAKRVGDGGPVLDMMAAGLETLAEQPLVAQSTLEATTAVARAAADLPDETHPDHQVFPEALFLQLLQAMAHPDAETRVLAHRILAILLPPLLSRDKSDPGSRARVGGALDWFLHHKDKGKVEEREARKMMAEGGMGLRTEMRAEVREGGRGIKGEGGTSSEGTSRDNSLPASPLTRSLEMMRTTGRSLQNIGRRRNSASKDLSADVYPVRMSGVQASLLLSSLWLQAHVANNKPPNFEAMSYTFALVVNLSRPKTTHHRTLVRALQLAFSLRAETLRAGSGDAHVPQLPAVIWRSLFSLSSTMLLAVQHAIGVVAAVAAAKAPLMGDMRDPFLEASDDGRLHVVSMTPAIHSNSTGLVYGSTFDQVQAANSMAAGTDLPPEETNGGILRTILSTNSVLTEMEGSDIAEKVEEAFVPDDSFALRPSRISDSLGPPSSPVTFTPRALELDPLPRNGVDEEDLVRAKSEADLAQFTGGDDAAGQAPSIDELLHELEMLDVSPTAHQPPLALPAPPVSPRFTAAMELFTQPEPSPPLHQPLVQPLWRDSVSTSQDKVATPPRLPLQPTSWNSQPMSPSYSHSAPREPWEFLKLPPSSTYDGFLKAAAL